MFTAVVFIIAKQNETQTEGYIDVQGQFPKYGLKKTVVRTLIP